MTFVTRAERFIDYFDALAGRPPDNIFQQDQPGGPRISALVYRDVPDPGMQIGVTYGLSLIDNPAWTRGRPELLIAVQSADDHWSRAAGLLAANIPDCPFTYGTVLNFGQPISQESAMDHFVVFAPAILDRDDFLNVLDAPEGAPPQDVVNLAGLYPIHASEAAAISDGRLEEFWKSGADLYDVTRPPVL